MAVDSESPPQAQSGRDGGTEIVIAEKTKFTMFQAVALNTMNMFGTGPLITIPYCLASVTPYGPQCMLGYTFAVFACICDSLVWGELGSRWPTSGGSQTYLRNIFGRDSRIGKFMSFIYFWQFLVSGPAEVASGCIAIAEYLIYFSPKLVTYGYRVLISLLSLTVILLGLYRSVPAVGRWANILMLITIFSILFTFVMSFVGWETSNLKTEWPDSPVSFIWAIGIATRFGVYDMTGYYDICFAGGEVENPRKTIPVSVVSTCVIIGIIYLLIYVSVISAYNFNEYIYMYTDDYDGVPVGIISLVTEHLIGKGAAYFITVIVAISIFGSVYAMTCGFVYIPAAAAKSGDFFKMFAHEHETAPGLYDYSLILIMALSACWCFFSLDVVIDAMVTMLVLTQFMAQSFGLLLYRYRKTEPDAPEIWKLPLFPVPCVVQLLLFGFIFITSDSYFLWGSQQPILEIAVCYIFLGLILFYLRERALAKNSEPVIDCANENVSDPKKSIGVSTEAISSQGV